MACKIVSAVLLAACVLAFAAPSFAGQSSSGKDTPFWFLDAPKDWPAQVMPGMRGGTEKLKSYIDNLIPILGTKDIILFADYKSVMGARGSNEENIGVGLRDLLFDEKLILGGNFFYDTRYTENRLRHNQLAFGLEGLTKWVDLRSNFYFPFSGKQLLTDDTTFVFRSRALDELDTYEEPLTGLDYEIGALIPCLSEYIETRAFIGGYNYFPTYGSGLNGIKARFEIRPIKAFTIDIEIKKDNYNPTECFVEGFITIPLDTMNVFKIKNPFTEFTRYFSYNKGIRSLRERMVDRIVRDIDITTKNTPIVESKAHDLTYVDNSYAGTVQDGTSEHPYAKIRDGVDHSVGDHWIYVREGKSQTTPYSQAVTLENNYVLWGSGYNGGFQNLSVSGVCPVIDGGGTINNLVTIKNNNIVMGLQLQNAANDGITFTDGTTLTGTIKYNICDNNGSDGIDLSFNTGTIASFTIYGNMCNTNGNDGIDLNANFRRGTISNFTISNNTCSNNSGDGLDFRNNSGTMRIFTISNNTCNNNTVDGIDLSTSTDSGTMSTFTISNNICNNNGAGSVGNTGGMDLSNNYGAISDFIFTHNTVTGNYCSGIILGGGTMTDIRFGNSATGAGGYNSIYGNNTGGGGFYDFNNNTGTAITAQNNWWGTTNDATIKSHISSSSNIIYSPYLSSDPN